jgi:hypothetical protein
MTAKFKMNSQKTRDKDFRILFPVSRDNKSDKFHSGNNLGKQFPRPHPQVTSFNFALERRNQHPLLELGWARLPPYRQKYTKMRVNKTDTSSRADKSCAQLLGH